MYFLFLDTETSSLTPSSGEIIEIAGVIAEFDQKTLKFKPISSYQSLAKPQVAIEAKIEKLTGITNLNLSIAKNKNIIMEEWANWLDEQPKIEGIIGHSIGFDESFLNSEKWYLPDVKLIDTLDWAKIILPEFYAINLEYIKGTIGFSGQELGLPQEVLASLAPHRALYDTYLCIHTANFLLSEFVNLPMTTEFAENFKKKYIKFNFNFYPSSLNIKELGIKELNEDQLSSNNNNITIKENNENVALFKTSVTSVGQFSKPSVENLISYFRSTDILKVNILCLHDHGDILDFLLTQIYFILAKKYLGKNKISSTLNYKIHAFGESSYSLNYIVLNSLVKFNTDQNNIVWEMPEKMISQTKQIIYSSLELGKAADLALILIDNLDKINNIESLNSTETSYTELLKKFSSNHDFLFFHLQNLFQNYEYTFLPDSSDLSVLNIKKQISQIQEIMENLKTCVLETNNPVIKAIYTSFITEISKFKLNPNNIYKIHNQNGTLSILLKNANFSLNSFVENVIAEKNINAIQTHLDHHSWKDFRYSLNLNKELENITTNFTERKNIVPPNENNLEQILANLYGKSVTENKICLVLAGQNSSLKDCQKRLSENFNYNQYLILGESGSLTKITSKIMNGFKGLVVGKVSNLSYFTNLKNTNISTICIINDPFLYIEEGFVTKEKRSEVLPDLKKIYLQSIANYSGIVFSNTEFMFVRSYI